MGTYSVGGSGTCPHCGRGVQFVSAAVVGIAGPSVSELHWVAFKEGRDTELPTGPNTSTTLESDRVCISACSCPMSNCRRLILEATYEKRNHEANTWEKTKSYLVYPRAGKRKPVPDKVQKDIQEDFEEACLVLQDSPKASAALSSRCLQAVLREQGYTQKDLSDQIEAVLPHLPIDIASMIDAVRNVGNFGAHPTKSKSTGEILPVEPGEAEWSTEVLEVLFDHYYARPSIIADKRTALNKKLQDAGKPPMKAP